MQQEQGDNYWQQDEQTPDSTQAAASDAEQTPGPAGDITPITWEASEYIDHHRDAAWFLGFGIITTLLIAGSIFLIQNYIFTALIAVMAIALLIYVKRPPQVIHYSLAESGLQIGETYHSFNNFRAFGIIQDGAFFAVKLLPTGRFSQELTIYFSEDTGEEIVDLLGEFLPMEQLQLDIVDRLLRRLRL
jgi:hypothetical protein